MSTAEEYFSPEYLIPWGSDDMRLRILDYLRRVQEAELYLQFGGLPLQVDTLAQLGVDGGPNNAISVANDDLRAVVPREHARMRALRYSSTDQIFASNVFAGLPYEAAAGVPYHVGLRYASYPTESRLADSGSFELVRWKEGIGESGQPLAVQDNGDGTLTFLLADTSDPGAGPLGGRPWPATNGGNRLVRVWLADPRVSYGEWDGTPVGQAVHTAATASDGTTVTVTVGHTFGQGTTPTTDPSKYRLVVHGPSIWRATDRNLLTFTEGSPAFQPYAYLGAVTDGVADTSAAPSTPSLGIVRFDLLQLAADAFDAPYTLDGDGAANLPAPLQQLIRLLRLDVGRAGQFGIGNGGGVVHVPGDMDAAQAWAENYTIDADPSPGRWLLTWGNVPNGTWVSAGDADQPGRVRFSGAQMGKVVAVVEANVTGNYVVFVETYTVSAAAAAESVGWRLNIAPLAGYLSEHLLKPYILTFDYDNGTGVISNETVTDMARTWRPTWDEGSYRLVKDSTGNVAALGVANSSGNPIVRLRALPAASAVNPGDPTATVMLLDRPDANTRRVLLPGPQGEGSNLVGGEAVELLPGGTGDIKQRHETGAVFWRKASSGVNKGYLSIAGGGQDDADADGQKPSFWVGDLKLIGTKTIDVEVPLETARDITGGVGAWSIDATFQAFLSASDTSKFAWLSPAWRAGQKLVGFRVRAFLSSPDPGDIVYAKIVKIDATSANGTVTTQTLVGGGAPTQVNWVDTETTPTQHDVLLATPATLSAGQRYKLELGTTISVGTVAYVTEVLAVFRFSDI